MRKASALLKEVRCAGDWRAALNGLYGEDAGKNVCPRAISDRRKMSLRDPCRSAVVLQSFQPTPSPEGVPT
jgi:hypothetical protein